MKWNADLVEKDQKRPAPMHRPALFRRYNQAATRLRRALTDAQWGSISICTRFRWR
jgi:hypothetical protein